jgi:dihydrofolate synthase/folylpolyglutamate synthase
MDFARSRTGVQAQLSRLAARARPRHLGLDRITALLARLGDPSRALPPAFHVAGTNGKGSTCAFLRAAIEAAGYTLHVYTSPHLVRFNERIRLAGRLIEDDALASLLDEVLGRRRDAPLSFFEATTGRRLTRLRRTPADAAIVEVGLGGRLDATNVIPASLVGGIAQLGLDHQQFLGDTIEQVATEKAGIARAGVPLVTQKYARRAAEQVSAAAAASGARWLPRGSEWEAIPNGGRLHYRDVAGEIALPLPRLPGNHQALNAALALAMLRHQEHLDVPATALRAMMGWAEWPARLQRLAPGPVTALLPAGSELWLDGAHNPAAARTIAAWLDTAPFGQRPLHLVLGVLASKDLAGLLRPFSGPSLTIHSVPVPGHAHHEPASIAAEARKLGLSAQASESVEAALAAIAGLRPGGEAPAVLIMGSLYLAGAVLEANEQLPT